MERKKVRELLVGGGRAGGAAPADPPTANATSKTPLLAGHQSTQVSSRAGSCDAGLAQSHLTAHLWFHWEERLEPGASVGGASVPWEEVLACAGASGRRRLRCSSSAEPKHTCNSCSLLILATFEAPSRRNLAVWGGCRFSTRPLGGGASPPCDPSQRTWTREVI